jgi:CDP-4-dehydro-6-deoxyglucose reductase, E3
VKVQVQLFKSDRRFDVGPDEPILTAARRAGLALPHSCLSGNCGSCRAQIVSGKVEYLRGRPLGITDEEIANGDVLLCQARAASDLVIKTRELRGAGEAGVQHLPCRVEEIKTDRDGCVLLQLRLPLTEEFRFSPGQLVDWIGKRGERISLAILSSPENYRPLVTRAASAADYRWRRGELGSIEGPFDAN